MAYVPRILFFRWKYFRFIKQGVFESYESRKSFSALANLESHFRIDILGQTNIVKSHTKFCSTLNSVKSKIEKPSNYKKAVLLSKFSKLKLTQLLDNPASFNETDLIILFKKICIVCNINKEDYKFTSNLHSLLKTEEFITFCTLLEKHLPRILPDDLPFLLSFKLFKVPVQSTLMRKIFTLILDNINNISVINILDMYLELNSSYFKNSEECKKIIKACEVYFANTLEDEVSHSRDLFELIFFTGEKALPLNVRQIIAERFFEILNNEKNLPPVLLLRLYYFTFQQPLSHVMRDKVLKSFKVSISISISTILQEKFLYEYQNAVAKDETLYDEEICKIFVERILNFRNYFDHCTAMLNSLCLLGYFDENLLNFTLDSLFASHHSSWLHKTGLLLASSLARISYHESNSPTWGKIKDILTNHNAYKENRFDYMQNLLQWTEYLTFLECDTRELLDTIFLLVSERDYRKQLRNSDCQKILLLHHLAKEYFSDGYTKSSEENLDFLLKKSHFTENFYSLSYVYEFFGGKNYVIKDCTNSHKHFIPLAVILGPDKKPISLSSDSTKNVKNDTAFNFFENARVLSNIENIPKPPGSTVIAFMAHLDNQPFQFRNVPKTSGMLRIFRKCYQKLGCNLVLLPRNYFLLEPEKKIKYLQSQVDEIMKKSETFK